MMTIVKYLGVIVFAGLFTVSAVAQERLVAEGRSPGLFLVHSVKKGENYFSLGRKYALAPLEIAKMNRLHFNKGLEVHQLIRIPLTAANFSQEKKSRGEPVYRKVKRGETLFKISTISNHVSLADLRSWNHLRSSKVEPGQYIVVGWLKKESAATIAAVETKNTAETVQPSSEQASDKSSPVKTARQAVTTPQVKSGDGDQGNDSFLSEVIADERTKHEGHTSGTNSALVSRPVKDNPPVRDNNATDDNATQAATEKPREDKVAVNPPVSAKDQDTAAPPSAFATMLDKVAGGSQAKSSPEPSAQANHVTPSQVAPAATQQAASATTSQAVPDASTAQAASASTPAADDNASGSPFFTSYQQQASAGQAVTEKGAAAWFKSNVQANSQRFYALNNSAPRGTIIKVTNPINGKFVYVKVLDVIPQVSGNAHLIIKISDAAMQQLGVTAARFFCELQYVK